MKNLLTSRTGNHSICCAGHFIYLVGGMGRDFQTAGTVERYNLCDDLWTQLPEQCDLFTIGVALVTVKSRFVFGFGGFSDQFKETDVFMRLDTTKLHLGWTSFNIQN